MTAGAPSVITCRSMSVHVPDAIAPTGSVARARASVFATLALWMGTPEAGPAIQEAGGYLVTVQEVSADTASARRVKE